MMAGLLPYAGLALLAVGELALLGFAASADVSETYRAFYIDKSSSCLPQPVTGAFELGRPISAGLATLPEFDAVAICGVAYTGAEGTWMFGPEARFHFAVPPGTQDLRFTLEGRRGHQRRLLVMANGTSVGMLDNDGHADESYGFAVPRALLADDGALDVTLLIENPPEPRNSVAARKFNFFIRSITLSLEQDERGSVSSGTAL